MQKPPIEQQWDQFVRQQPHAHALQLSAWGELKSAYGWKSEQVIVKDNSEIIAGAQILYRPLPARLGTMAYLPFGPYCKDPERNADLWAQIDRSARERGAAFLKWEPGIDANPNTSGFRPSPQTVQPPSTILIDIADEETMLARMNQSTRRKIRKSLKGGAIYREGSTEDVKRFGQLMQTTGSRNEFGVHETAYYELAYRLFAPQDAALLLVEYEGELLAGVMIFAVGDTAWYLYGASSDERRELMASYGIQWQAILWARSRGCKVYDMWGIPDANEATLETEFEQRSDGLWGVYRFKRGWGGRVVRSAGAWDRVYNPIIYTAYRAALRLRG